MNHINGTVNHFGTNRFIRCPADAILNGLEEDQFETEHRVSKPRRYDNLLEYCREVAEELVQRQAFYTVDLADVLWKVQEWTKRLPKVDMFYAVKANTDPVLLQLLTMMGISFDCASEDEIRSVLKAGASPKNIIFAHTIKTEDELKFASKKGVELMTFDNEDELRKICRVYPSARLVIRISPASVSCYFDLSDKFGCNEEEAVQLLKLAKRLDLLVVGVSFHVGALCTDPKSYTLTIQKCRELFATAKEIGFSFSILDIGGGFFGQIGTEGMVYEVADSICESLNEHFPGDDVRVIAEPGNYIAVSAVRLVCTVIGKRCFENAGEGRPARHYFLNDGIYGSFFRDIECYGLNLKPLLPESEIQSRAEFDSRLFGQTCCSEDVIRLNTKLPDLQIGEKLMWENMGAYSRGICSTFCGVLLPVPRYVFVKNQRLNMDWMESKNVGDFVRKQSVFIERNI